VVMTYFLIGFTVCMYYCSYPTDLRSLPKTRRDITKYQERPLSSSTILSMVTTM
jgi:hypothetical protein